MPHRSNTWRRRRTTPGLRWRAWPIWPGSWARSRTATASTTSRSWGATLRGWAIRLAMAADDPALVEDLTGRRWRQLDPPDAT
jgi:hypothetical protein